MEYKEVTVRHQREDHIVRLYPPRHLADGSDSFRFELNGQSDALNRDKNGIWIGANWINEEFRRKIGLAFDNNG
ncbi:MAG: hypothetical protein H0X33_00825 [Taibaiella sp.]|nr:hypothetical protein [Taibaiella sp.]